MQWGENQLQIIRHREGNLIVSAAAGAGKTEQPNPKPEEPGGNQDSSDS